MSKIPRFGELLKEYRIQRGLSQEQVAEILGCSASLISRIENGLKKPPKNIWFYQNLYLLPEIDQFQVDILLVSPGVPKGYAETIWAFREQLSLDFSSHVSEKPFHLLEVRTKGVRVILRVEADSENISDVELSGIAKVATAEIESFLTFYMRHLKDRRLRHKTG